MIYFGACWVLWDITCRFMPCAQRVTLPEIMPRKFNKRKSSTPNAINCTNIECHGVPPIGFQNMQTDLNKFSSVANNERIHLFLRYSTNCSPTELLELQSPMAEIQSETVSIHSFLNGAIQRPLSYEQHIMNQNLACAKNLFWEELFTCIQSILWYGAKT